ncbi:hypothetical protein OnM2_064004 [Erysiphe neolycopersici]|uniref:YMC020W-like alpha/beta hydrolase domain-containing protein n=1 Tax=Erysiphe neolycopersici TaxID=212602 RepID=A0A420HN31_9PEZI|nr:hypothetical protein OnM2_064004 [Erysiphe neolycopersici]
MRRIKQSKDAISPSENASLITTNVESTQTNQTSDINTNDTTAASQNILESLPSSSKQLRPRSSWYGTWPRKSTASTKLAKESIIAEIGTNKSVTMGTGYSEDTKPTWNERPPSMHFGKSKETLGITMANTVDSDNTTYSNFEPRISDKDGANSSEHALRDHSKTQKEPEQASQKLETESISSPIYQGWFESLLGRSNSQPPHKNDSESVIDTSSKISDEINDFQSSEAPSYSYTSLSWLGWLPITSSSKSITPTNQTPTPSLIFKAPLEQMPKASDEYRRDLSNNVSQSKTVPVIKAEGSNTGYPWTFWSKESSNPSGAAGTHGLPETTIDVKSSSFNDLQSTQNKIANGLVDKQCSAEDESKKPNTVTSLKLISTKDQLKQETSLQTGNSDKNAPLNLLLPSLRSTYQVYEAPSTIEKITRFFNFGKKLDVKHVSLSKEQPKVSKAVVIGIHGLVPAPLIRTVIGQPTGTSIRFANHAADAIRRWTKTHNTENCDIEIVALEGGGKISDRVDILWKLLLNWINHIQKADFILVACHSQGVPVSVMLVAKLIEFGVVTTGRIGICAMAGVSLGPFIEYKSRLIGGSAGELFEFADPESDISKKYKRSLQTSLNYGVRVMFCGSIDDQLVSMESSIFSSVSHPYIYRAVFIDGRIHAPDFLSHLVGFALKLRNIGISDHGLIRELSAPLAGSLYTGEGHSRLYDDSQVYELAVQFALETTSIKNVPLGFTNHKLPMTSNPYVLPWIMRGLLEEDYVKTKLTDETIELLKMFDDWKPSTKVLKDVKYRLEVVKSKL